VKKFELVESEGKLNLVVDGEVSDPSGSFHASYLIEYLMREDYNITQQLQLLEAARNIIHNDVSKLRLDEEYARTYLDNIDKRCLEDV
jgi:hypothetical protein